MVKVEWKEHHGKDATWEMEDEMRTRHPELFLEQGESQRKRQNYENRRVPFNAKRKANTGSSSNSNQEGDAKSTCASCGKPHFGVCRWASGACFECGEMGHRVKDCPKTKADDGKKNGNTSGSAQKGNVGKG
ncbi:uncharacterized protein LOC114271185 [Camellia sinensis]|uniref:uncharacterized protein LOC114271185 n=1 Tax=Camellia sinensis TaxID=4442 RepID=UPI001036A985|nr:uncharacterized protein LOC114271185 [Camellia sinensis]